MATLYADAIEIITDDGRGIPVSYFNAGIGLASDGHFALITGRFGLNGSKTITGDTARTTWYERIMTADASGFGISRTADFVEAGCLEMVSGLSFGIVNTAGFWSTLAANGVYLGRRTVKYYRVTSTDGITFNFELRWTGVVDDQPFTETTFTVQCVDASKDLFKTLPVQSVNRINFPNSPDDSQDKAIPIAIGRVGYSPMVNVSKPQPKPILVKNGVIEYTACALRAGSYDPVAKTVSLYTRGMTFTKDDLRLKDCQLTIIAGGNAQSILIRGNAATTTDGHENTQVTLEEPFSGTFVGWATPHTNSDVWFCEVQKMAATLIASTRPINALVKNSFGRASVSSYDSNSNRYADISEVEREASASNVANTGKPGIDVAAKDIDASGDISAFVKIRSTGIINRGTSGCTYTGPGMGMDQPSLYDVDQASAYHISAVSGMIGTLVFEVSIPQAILNQTFDDIYLLVDLLQQDTTAPVGNQQVSVSILSEDIYGQASAATIAGQTLWNAPVGAAQVPVHTIGGVYYGSPASPDLFYTLKDGSSPGLSVKDAIGNIANARAFPRLLVQLNFLTYSTYQADLQEIGLVGKRVLNVNNDQAYCSLRGETFATTWDGRKTASSYPDNPVDAFEHLFRNYDIDAPSWTTGKAYLVGNQVRGTAIRGHLFVCTTAGTSGGTEPTWTDTAGAAYTDGTAHWTELKDMPIDTAAFDVASGQRAAWKVGRSPAEKKPSAEYYNTLLAQSFLIALTDRKGKLAVKAWRENTDALATFDSSTIIEGTLGEMKRSAMSRVYNDLTIPYDRNPGANKFNRQLVVTKVDQAAFPAADRLSDTVSVLAALGTFTASAITVFQLGAIWYARYRFTLTTAPSIPLVTGNYVRLTGNTDGYNFQPLPISVTSTTVFYVDALYTSTPTSNPSSTGTLQQLDGNLLAWKEFVAGISDYMTAQDLWEQCHSSYLISKAINKLPQQLGECEWFLDPYAKDPAGTLLWPELSGVGDEHAAVFFARNLVNWTAWQKKQITFEVVDSAAYSALNIGDCVAFQDDKLTVGGALIAWIHEKTQLPGTDALPPRFRFGITFSPEAFVPASDVITESGSQPNTITESGSQTNTYTEGI